MQAFKLKGTVDESGKLIVDEAVSLTPGEVEIILLKPVVPSNENLVDVDDEATLTEVAFERGSSKAGSFKTKVKALETWFENASPAPQDFDSDDARWQALKEKYNL